MEGPTKKSLTWTSWGLMLLLYCKKNRLEALSIGFSWLLWMAFVVLRHTAFGMFSIALQCISRFFGNILQKILFGTFCKNAQKKDGKSAYNFLQLFYNFCPEPDGTGGHTMESKKLEKPRENGTFSTVQGVMKPDEEGRRVFPTMKPLDWRTARKPAWNLGFRVVGFTTVTTILLQIKILGWKDTGPPVRWRSRFAITIWSWTNNERGFGISSRISFILGSSPIF